MASETWTVDALRERLTAPAFAPGTPGFGLTQMGPSVRVYVFDGAMGRRFNDIPLGDVVGRSWKGGADFTGYKWRQRLADAVSADVRAALDAALGGAR